jgi:hypothetical protein
VATFGSVDVAVKFLADASSVNKEADKLQGTGSKVKTWAKGVGLAIGGAFSVKAVSDFIGAAEEANAVQAKLTQALANAGDASGEYAKHAADLANTLQYKTGIDDEVIKGGQTILATFHDVSDAAGQQSGVFDRATKAALDMSKAGFGSVDSAATMLGKALQDPAKGLTALGRAGVTFSDDQKKAIKAMVDSGDKAGAMQAILKEVEGQVGGVAEASVTSGDKMKVAWGETKESIGNALLPLMETLAPIIASIAQWVQENTNLVIALGILAAAIWVVNIAMAANPVTLIIMGIMALIVAVVLLWNNWETIWGFITDLVATAAGWIVDKIQPIIDALGWLWDTFRNVWNWIKDAVGTAVAFIGDHWRLLVTLIFPVVGILLWLWDNWRSIWDKIKSFLGSAVSWIGDKIAAIVGFFRGLPGQIGSAIADLGAIIVKPFQWAWDQIVIVADGIKSAFTGAIDIVKSAWNAFARFWNGIEVDVPSIDMPGPVPDIGGFTFGLPDLPTFAQGGIVTRPTLAIVGEAGPEAIVPLNGTARAGATIIIEQLTVQETLDVDEVMRRMAFNLRRAQI